MTLNVSKKLIVGEKSYTYYSLKAADTEGIKKLETLPFCLKILVENLLRHLDGERVTVDDLKAFTTWVEKRTSEREVAFHPTRVLMQDFTGVPAVADLAGMRQAMKDMGGDPQKINPLTPVDLVIDHSVMVDHFGTPDAMKLNTELEVERNKERYQFLRWGQQAFKNFRVVPPGTGICHQVNLEYLAKVIWHEEKNGELTAYPDTLVGTDSHTTMINGVSVLGWGVGGIEAEAVMLGQPISMLIPEVIGFKLIGTLREGATATDLVLTVTQMLRERGVVGKFVEFFGPGLDQLPLADRATVANMAPEYGATCGIFPIDQETIKYLELTGRDPQTIALVEAYSKEQGLWREKESPDPVFTDTLVLDLATVEPSIAGPKRPQDRILLSQAAKVFNESMLEDSQDIFPTVNIKGTDHHLTHGDVVIAAITSCTNTSNPSVMVGAGLLARKALEKGLKVKPWVKTSLAPGSQVVSGYLESAGLQKDLDKLGFNVVGYGCTTCIGNSGPLADNIIEAIEKEDLTVCAVLSGNRNFEGRINPHTKNNYLASPLLVVAYAIAGSIRINLLKSPLGQDKDGTPVYLSDIWPTTQEIQSIVHKSLSPEIFLQRYGDVFKGDKIWQELEVPEDETYVWNDKSTYVKEPPFFKDLGESKNSVSIEKAHILALLGDSVTTDHISPAGAIKKDAPAGKYLTDNKVKLEDFNSYGSRRGNHEVMVRGTFANIRLQNEMTPDVRGGYTKLMPENEETTIYEASKAYQAKEVPLVVVAGKEYGTGSSRDWAAKGTKLLGVKAVIAESFERIHRSNLIGMGILPLMFTGSHNRKSLGLTGEETVTINIEELEPKQRVEVEFNYPGGRQEKVKMLVRIDTKDELDYYENEGILSFVLKKIKTAS